MTFPTAPLPSQPASKQANTLFSTISVSPLSPSSLQYPLNLLPVLLLPPPPPLLPPDKHNNNNNVLIVEDIESTRGDDIYSEDDPDGHGSHVGGSVAGSIYSGWAGPADCPDGVGDATEEQTALSCVGVCLDPDVLEEYVSDNTFDLDALCPEVLFCVCVLLCFWLVLLHGYSCFCCAFDLFAARGLG